MKKAYQIILAISLVLLGYWLWVYSEIDQYLLYLIIINIIAYIGRTIIIRSVNSALKGKVIRYVISMVINIIWIGILFTLLFYSAPDFSVAIISFLIVAISLTFKERIDNIVSGILILTAEDFEIGDMVEINSIQGIIEDITLNYTKMKNFSGISVFLSNIDVYQSATKKFTNREIEENDNSSEESSKLTQIVSKFSEVIAKGEKLTRYLNILSINPDVTPNQLENLLNEVFDKYETIFGFRPFYYVNYTELDRVNVTIQVLSKKPKKIIFFVNAFLRDIAFKLYSKRIQKGCEQYEIQNENIAKMLEGNV